MPLKIRNSHGNQSSSVTATRAGKHRLERRDGHALPVNRIETRHRIPEDQESIGKAVQLLKAAPDAGGEPRACGLTQGLGIPDHLVDEGCRQAARKFNEAF
jgi:hypothetical protein